MPPLIDLGFCPCCLETFIDIPTGVIINARFCRICADQFRGDLKLEEFWHEKAKALKEKIER